MNNIFTSPYALSARFLSAVPLGAPPHPRSPGSPTQGLESRENIGE